LQQQQQQQHESISHASHHLPPRIASSSSRKHEQDMRPSRSINAAAAVRHVPLMLSRARSPSASASDYSEHESASADGPANSFHPSTFQHTTWQQQQQQQHESISHSSHHLPPRIASSSSRKHEQDMRPSRSINAAAAVRHVPLMLSRARSPSASASDYSEHESASADGPIYSSPANQFINTGKMSLLQIPTTNPYIPSKAVRVKRPSVNMVFDDSDSEDGNHKPRVSKPPELTAQEKRSLEVHRQQFDHLVEAVKSKKLAGAVKISHGLNALRLARDLQSTHAQVDNALADLQLVLNKLAWDYHSLFLEAETFNILLDICIDSRSTLYSKSALQVLLVVFERDVRVNGGSIRADFFDALQGVIDSCLQCEDGEFQLEWGLWFVS
jgi:hypothetical protein